MRFFRKRKTIKPEKIRMRVRGGRLVSVYYPAHIVGDHMKHATARQEVFCYEIKLNGSPMLGYLGLGSGANYTGNYD